MIITEEQVEKVLKKVGENYKYTKLNNDFIRTALGDRLFVIDETFLNGRRKRVINPTSDFKLIIGIGKFYPVRDLRILQNDFELTDLAGRLDDKLSKQWQEGMIKRALPLKDEEFKLDANSYINDLYLYEHKKVVDNTNKLYNMLIKREIDEKDE